MGGESPVWVLGSVAFALGLVVGSFLNVVIHRLPRGESVARPRSRCPGCRRPIRWYENVPLLSWLALRARCAGCGMRIPVRYPLVELLTGLYFAAVVWVHGPVFMTPLWWTFGALLLVGAGIDFDERWIPDGVSLGGLALGLVVVPLARSLDGAALGPAFGVSALGALLGGGLLWLVGFAHARVSVALGRTFEHWPGEGQALPGPGSLDYWTWFPGLGFGDVKLMAMVGSFLGPLGVVEVILLAALLGLLVGGAFALARRDASVPFGFGPAIAAAAALLAVVPVGLLSGLLASGL